MQPKSTILVHMLFMVKGLTGCGRVSGLLTVIPITLCHVL